MYIIAPVAITDPSFQCSGYHHGKRGAAIWAQDFLKCQVPKLMAGRAGLLRDHKVQGHTDLLKAWLSHGSGQPARAPYYRGEETTAKWKKLFTVLKGEGLIPVGDFLISPG